MTIALGFEDGPVDGAEDRGMDGQGGHCGTGEHLMVLALSLLPGIVAIDGSRGAATFELLYLHHKILRHDDPPNHSPERLNHSTFPESSLRERGLAGPLLERIRCVRPLAFERLAHRLAPTLGHLLQSHRCYLNYGVQIIPDCNFDW
jgi:hypothetical protein